MGSGIVKLELEVNNNGDITEIKYGRTGDEQLAAEFAVICDAVFAPDPIYFISDEKEGDS